MIISLLHFNESTLSRSVIDQSLAVRRHRLVATQTGSDYSPIPQRKSMRAVITSKIRLIKITGTWIPAVWKFQMGKVCIKPGLKRAIGRGCSMYNRKNIKRDRKRENKILENIGNLSNRWVYVVSAADGSFLRGFANDLMRFKCQKKSTDSLVLSIFGENRLF